MPDSLIQSKLDKQMQGQVRSPKVWKKFISLTNVTEIRPLSCSRWSDVSTSHRCSKFHHHSFITSETRGHTGNVATGLHQHITQELRAPLCDDCTCNCKGEFLQRCTCSLSRYSINQPKSACQRQKCRSYSPKNVCSSRSTFILGLEGHNLSERCWSKLSSSVRRNKKTDFVL